MFYMNKFLVVILLLTLISCNNQISSLNRFESNWPKYAHRHWIGPEYWSNRLEDWQIHNGRLECINGELQLRTVHLLTRELSDRTGTLEMEVTTGVLSDEMRVDDDTWTGFMVGAGNNELDYRARALIHVSSGEGGGLIAALNGRGKIIFLDNENDLEPMQAVEVSGGKINLSSDAIFKLKLSLLPRENDYKIILSVYNKNQKVAESYIENVPASRLSGNVALACSNGMLKQTCPSYWYEDWKISGSKLSIHDERVYGPVYGVMYTLSRNTLKLTVQFAPMGKNDPMSVALEIPDTTSGTWKKIGEENIVTPGWTATFRNPDWERTQDVDFRIVYRLQKGRGKHQFHHFKGIIKHDPIEKEEIIIAGFTGNNNVLEPFYKWNGDLSANFTKNHIWFPHTDLTGRVKKHNPDLLVYTGDQIYEGHPYRPDKSGDFSSYLNYLQKWYLFYWAHGDLTRNIPAICIPDDHDVFQINLWGAGGRPARKLPEILDSLPERYQNRTNVYCCDGGGFEMPPDWVNMVDRTQTSHLPDPFDPVQLDSGIGVYFTDMLYGGISFAIIEDRKFKSSPDILVPEAKQVGGFPTVQGFDPVIADKPEAVLLGERQLKFLDYWAADWKGAYMKICISQTIFTNLSTKGPEGSRSILAGSYPDGHRQTTDFDSNGWPQSKRNQTLRSIRKGFALMLGGDQHLGSVVHHGTDHWEDAGFSFCVPAIANLAPRRWFPPNAGMMHLEGMPKYTGRYFDGFGNKITVLAVSNPYVTGEKPESLYDRATGYGIIKLNKKTQKITLECWPRYADPDQDEQFTGWPITIDMAENYAREAHAWLPLIQTTGLDNPPVIQVINERNNEIVYTIRARTMEFKPKVFAKGSYTIHVGEPGTEKLETKTGIETIEDGTIEIIKIDFTD